MSDLTERARTSDGYRVVKEPSGNFIKADTELIRELADRIDKLETAIIHAYYRQDTDPEGALDDLRQALGGDDE